MNAIFATDDRVNLFDAVSVYRAHLGDIRIEVRAEVEAHVAAIVAGAAFPEYVDRKLKLEYLALIERANFHLGSYHAINAIRRDLRKTNGAALERSFIAGLAA